MERIPQTKKGKRNIGRLVEFEDGVWIDNECGAAPKYLPGHAVARFRNLLILELAELVNPSDFEQCASRASEALQIPVEVA